MINKLVLQNFKCFRKIEVNPRLITVFIGPNGTGKSSVLQGLALLRQSIGGQKLALRGSLLNFIDARDTIPYFQQPDAIQAYSISGSKKRRLLDSKNFSDDATYSYRAEFFRSELASHSQEIRFSYDDKLVVVGVENLTVTTIKPDQLGPYRVDLRHQMQIARQLSVSRWIDEPDDVRIRDGFQAMLDVPFRDISDFRFTPAARGLVMPQYELGADTAHDVSGIGGLSEQERQTATNLVYESELAKKITSWLQKVTGVGLQAEMIPSRAVKVQSITGVGPVNIASEGFGSNALILLFMQLADVSPGSTLAIEEPEIHLHPRAQADLASVLVDEAKGENKQLIITTHSEHFLGRLLTLVAEGSLSSNDLAVYAFEKDDQGVCSAQNLDVTDDGRVKGGVKGFFEADLEELERYIKALQYKE